MIQLRTMLKVADNSGAKILQCIHVLGGSGKRYGRIGSVIVGVVKVAEPRREVKKHDVTRALIVRQRKEYRRPDGSYVRFDDNACVILDEKTKKPKGGRIFGPIAREIKEKGFEKVAALAKEIV
ncbi:MAG: 50S ribosomal protein L14 [Patescibacteria group bacterium]|nr:50S ribosomal protein L14 [Patescibacteria group bacterium]